MLNLTSPKNVQGAERAASIIGGLALLGNGIRTGGLSGVLQMAVGGMAIFRGATGHCELKRIIEEKKEHSNSNDIQRYSHMPLDSETHSPDFQSQKALPDSTPMGHEARPNTP
ncbi:hypothetical protein BN1049_00318 [Pseudomonas saudimassiliensis]|uniref:Inner membrane protein YgaP-like transmembrane domain-containing protein n=1 Tax=Pseudomonas saudimassiliensis TaxID=1461581 RepID=A0A078M4G0_9PSED|nr:DUF2892 domain-containing protein [Pseudomonas saudimassiliensis]CEA01155.1 hypothetical protein BN1049_00318 [Pseudomonas saudimassiliensis]CEF25416.1 hypothetical protein BN1049_00318 [Pseudomonas saudimassiliensis]